MSFLKPYHFLKKDLVIALLAGAFCVFGFAPFGIFPVPVVALAVLFTLWLRTNSPRVAAWQGFMFGIGLFSTGISWIYIALHDYGEMTIPLAASATLLFAVFLALFTALAGYLQARIPISITLRTVLLMPAIWVLIEWLRGMIFTGFPWLTFGYAHSDSPLAGYAPLFGVYGVSLIAAVGAGLIALLLVRVVFPAIFVQRDDVKEISSSGIHKVCGLRTNATLIALAIFILLWVGGEILRAVTWTQPQGEPISVSLVQGNIAQGLKFQDGALVNTLETYRRLALESRARLIVLPETAFPMLRSEVPPFLIELLRNHARQNGGDMLIGSFVGNNGNYYNSVFSTGSAKEQHYHKHHLVPFGEFIPLRSLLGWFINGVLNIPMSDLGRGDTVQEPLEVAGQRIAVDICYEDVFGEEIIRSMPQATMLVNFTNDAWYGESHAAAQHNQIAQFRAMETGRMMLRATNTGVTSIIDRDGRVVEQLSQHQEGVLNGVAQGYQGLTPYAYWGNAAVMLLMLMMLIYAWVRRGK
jgi:apolipoprotein N-acyltransferase